MRREMLGLKKDGGYQMCGKPEYISSYFRAG